jgi:hypothetical protein
VGFSNIFCCKLDPVKNSRVKAAFAGVNGSISLDFKESLTTSAAGSV